MVKKYERQRLLGKKIKTFNILQQLGSGAYGSVYKAIDTITNEIFAIKVMSKKQIYQIPKLQQLVKTQIKALKLIKNQNVINFIDQFRSGDNVFIVTQYCNGGDLQNYCKKHGNISEIQAVGFLKQILNGFKGLHEINIMHRDFKLANVLLNNYVCKIADLGFAKELKAQSLTYTRLGTDETMAPEVHQGKQYGWIADIWSIGVVFYQMLYNRVPFHGYDQETILKSIKTTTPRFDDIDISQQAIDFIKRCLTYNPNNRISWKQIYNHSLLYRSDITLTTVLLHSRLNVKQCKKYYDKNQNQKKQLINFNQIINNDIKQIDIFLSVGQLKNADKQAQNKKIAKQKFQNQIQNIQNRIIKDRNNRMFGITLIIPFQRIFSNIYINHSQALYQICKHAYIQLKKLREQITLDKKTSENIMYWKQFKNQSIYKNICNQLLEDEMFAASLAISYKKDLVENNDNINRPTNADKFKNIITHYRKKLTPYLQDQPERTKIRFIKMLKALKEIEQNNQWDFNRFNQQNQKIDIKQQQKHLISSIQ